MKSIAWIVGASEGISGALHPALLRLHVAAEGRVDAALITPALCFEEVHYVGIEPKRDLFLLARPEGRSRKESVIELGRIGKVDVPVLHGFNLCPICF